MKHILTEKYNLLEKIILKEAVFGDNLNALLSKITSDYYSKNNINNILDSLINVQDYETIKNNLNKELELINKSIKSKASVEGLRSEIQKYLDIFKNSFTNLEINKNPNVVLEKTKLENMIDANVNSENLITEFNNFSDAVNIMLNQKANEKLNNKDITELRSLLQQLRDKIDDLVFYIKNDIYKEQDQENLNKIDLLAAKLNNDLPVEIDASLEQRQLLKKAISSIDEFNAEATKIIEVNSVKNAQNNIDDNFNWDMLFKERMTEEEINVLWDRYYKAAWGNNAEKVKNLGIAFQQEVLSLGFTEKTNPFLTYLRTLINGETIISSFNLNRNTYGAIHNGYVGGTISRAVLINKSAIFAPNYHVIFWSDLYNKKSDEINEYIVIINNIANLAKISKDFNNKATSKYGTELVEGETLKQFIVDLFSESGSTINTNSGTLNSKLKPIVAIKTELAEYFGEDIIKDKKPVSKNDLTMIAANLGIFGPGNADAARKYIAAILSRWADPKNWSVLQDKYNIGTISMRELASTSEKLRALEETKKITANSAIALADEIAKIAGLI